MQPGKDDSAYAGAVEGGHAYEVRSQSVGLTVATRHQTFGSARRELERLRGYGKEAEIVPMGSSQQPNTVAAE